MRKKENNSKKMPSTLREGYVLLLILLLEGLSRTETKETITKYTKIFWRIVKKLMQRIKENLWGYHREEELRAFMWWIHDEEHCPIHTYIHTYMRVSILHRIIKRAAEGINRPRGRCVRSAPSDFDKEERAEKKKVVRDRLTPSRWSPNQMYHFDQNLQISFCSLPLKLTITYQTFTKIQP